MRNKFISHLADDVIQENHHLKDEVIKMRKKLKKFEQLMLKQLIDVGVEPGEGRQGYVYDDADECLDQFVKLVKKNNKIVKEYETQLKKIKKNNIDLKDKNIKLNKTNKQLNQKQIILDNVIERTQNEKKQKYIEYENLIQQKDARIKQVYEKMAQLQLSTQETVQKIKVQALQEKKRTIEETNKDKANYRKKLQTETWQLQKKLKTQIDKKDKDVKTMLATISSIVNKTDVQSQNIQFLQLLMKPFQEHNVLNQKISELRKQSINFKNQSRQAHSKCITLQYKIQQLQAEIDIGLTKIEKLTKDNLNYTEEHERMSKELKESLEDKDRMQQYYNERWNKEFTAVKINLQKKYDIKITSAQVEYEEKKRELQQERRKLVKEKTAYFSHLAQLKAQIAQNHRFINTFVQKQKGYKHTIQEKNSQIRQLAKMSKQQLLMKQHDQKMQIHHQKQQYHKEIIKHKEIVTKMQNTVLQCQQKIAKTIQEKQNKIKEIHEQKQLKIKQIKTISEDEVRKHRVKSEQLKLHVQSVKKQYIILLEEQKNKMINDKEQEREQMKNETFRNIIREKETNIELSLKIAQLKKKHSEELEENIKIEKKFEKKLLEKQVKMQQYEKKLRSLSKVSSIYEEETKKYKQRQQQLLYNIKSLNVLLNSRTMQIENINMEVKDLLQERKTFGREIIEIKRQFKQGFIELKEVCERRINYYKSKIWDLQKITNSTSNKRDVQKIKILTQENSRLQDKISLRQAQILILKEVKSYYQIKLRQADSKMTLKYELKDSFPIMMRKPKKRIIQMKNQKSEPALSLPQDKQVTEMKRYINRDSSNRSRVKNKMQRDSRKKLRVNSSMA